MPGARQLPGNYCVTRVLALCKPPYKRRVDWLCFLLWLPSLYSKLLPRADSRPERLRLKDQDEATGMVFLGLRLPDPFLQEGC
jgi:hypothetical protein